MKLHVFVVVLLLGGAVAWEMELYDLVEELDKDFYTVMGLNRDADHKEIRSAFKRLSLQLHPDKNDSPDAEVVFRQLVDVYNVLKDKEKREKYEYVLENGLPDWRHAAYYYRRVRKMGILEMLTILFIIITIGQYITAWAAYWERCFTINEYVETQEKRLRKKFKKGKIEEMPDFNFEIPQPSVWNVLPFQICRFTWWSLVSVPSLIVAIYAYLTKPKEIIEESSEEEEEVEPMFTRGPRRRRNFVIPEGRDEPAPSVQALPNKTAPSAPAVVSGGIWTDDDLAELIRLVKKFPPGTPKRWEKVAEVLNRSVAEVTLMSKKVKDGLTVRSEAPEEVTPVPEKVKTKGGKTLDVVESEWSSTQQKALEQALVQYTKQVAERWDHIAKAVPGKTKEECMLRYKQLAEAVRRKKEEIDTDAQPI